MKTFIAVITILLAVFLLKTNFDTNLLYISPLEKDQLSNRYEFYAQSLGKLYKNRVGIYVYNSVSPYVYKYSRNLAYNLDPNLYFFAAHPRERVGVDEFSKFSLITLPFFIIGIGVILSGGQIFLIIYFLLSILVSAFLFPGYSIGPILMFPFVVVVIYLGFLRLFKKFI